MALEPVWWFGLFGLIITLAVGFNVYRAPGIYVQQVDVVFIWPQVPENTENTFQYGTDSLIKTAGVVGKIVGDRGHSAQVVSSAVGLVDQGIQHGYSVRLPNSGGQWALNFERPVLRVEAVGTTPGEVQQTTQLAVNRINEELLALQTSEEVPAELMIRTRLSPPIMSVDYATGSKIRALLASQLLGLTLTCAAMIYLHRRRSPSRETAMSSDQPTSEQRKKPLEV